MELPVRFSSLVRSGLRFRRTFELAKQRVGGGNWYLYDSFSNLFLIEELRRQAGLSLAELSAGEPVLDLGAADGALAFLFESLGHRVHACDHAGTNMNHMQGIRQLAGALHSDIEIEDVDLDGPWRLQRQYGLALFLGTLYHLKNPFAVLERLSRHARYCLLSTRVASWSPDHTVELGRVPVAYLVGPEECNGDPTNYWVFSPPGLIRLAERSGWQVLASTKMGATDSDPAHGSADERQFLLLKSRRTRENPKPELAESTQDRDSN